MTALRVRGVAVLAGLVLLTIGAGHVPTASARAGQGAPPAATAPVAASDEPILRITSQSTYVPANGVFRARVLVRNAPDGSYISTTLHRRVRDRDEFTASVSDGDAFDLPDRIATFDTEPDGDLGIAVADITTVAGSNTDRTLRSVIPIRVPDGPNRPTPKPRPVGRTDEQTLDETGVYPVQYRLLASNGAELARVVTHIVRLPTQAERPSARERLRVATVLPLTATPVLQPDGSRTVDDTVLDRITTVIDALARQTDAAITLNIDPQALATLTTADARDGTDELDRLEVFASSDDHQVLTTTYAGVDTRAFTDAGLGDELLVQRVKAIESLTDRLVAPDVGTWAALPDLSPATVTELRSLGVNQLIVPEAILSSLDDRWPNGLYEPFKVVTDEGVPMPAVQADRQLQAAFARNDDPVLNAHQLVAEVALIADGANGGATTPGGVVVMPPAGWAPNSSFLRILLDGLGEGATVTTPVTVDRLFDTIPPAAANGPQATDRGGDLTRTLNPLSGGDLGSYPARLTEQRSRLASLGSIVGETAPPTHRARDLLDVSGARTLSPAARAAYVAGAADRLSTQFGRVSAPDTEQVTLTARNAQIPMTVTSGLLGPAEVIIELEGSNRLSFPNGDEVDATLTPGRNRVEVRVKAPTSGDSPLRMRVLSPDRRVVLAETRYTVRSTAVSGVGLVLTVGAFGFLLIWWVRHWRSRRRRGRHASADRHPSAVTPPEPEHDPEAPTEPRGVTAVGSDRDG